MPAKRLIENRLEREFPLVPLLGHPAGFERHGSRPPRVLEPTTRELLRVEINHVREVAARPAHVAPAVQTPSGAALHAVLQRRQRVEIHQQERAREGGEVDVDQLSLDRPAWEIRSPAFAPIPDCRDIHVIQIGMPVVALPGFDDQRAPRRRIQRVVGIGRPDRAVLVRGRIGSLCP